MRKEGSNDKQRSQSSIKRKKEQVIKNAIRKENLPK